MFLADNRSKFSKPESRHGSVLNSPDIIQRNEFVKVSRELFDYCQTLEYETIKILQTIMCLGRDKDHCHVLGHHEIYEKARNYKDNVIGWRTKELDIYQIIEKELLHQYLRDGLAILGLHHLL
ncbi:MAG: hypothetical protein K0R21_555 [Anaerocolumna sp.]|nr:hypothetical protein [Anaerocolumna sp.]